MSVSITVTVSLYTLAYSNMDPGLSLAQSMDPGLETPASVSSAWRPLARGKVGVGNRLTCCRSSLDNTSIVADIKLSIILGLV